MFRIENGNGCICCDVGGHMEYSHKSTTQFICKVMPKNWLGAIEFKNP